MRTIKFRAWQDDKMLYAKTSGVMEQKSFLIGYMKTVN